MAKEHNIFISHAWDYTTDVEALRSLINARPYFNCTYSDVSKYEPINSFSAPYIKQRLKAKILNSHVMIGMAGIYASHSDWMKWELDTALANNIPIIGVVPRGATRISTIVSNRAIDIVRWNTESIINAVRMHSLA
ncbi:TIR domain-containing protein [Proteus mirabilis]|nr:TIR domain-containing protein [Proteus mirabilis]HEK2976026.1 TIR domain-containing protein [Proteus mirabilis]